MIYQSEILPPSCLPPGRDTKCTNKASVFNYIVSFVSLPTGSRFVESLTKFQTDMLSIYQSTDAFEVCFFEVMVMILSAEAEFVISANAAMVAAVAFTTCLIKLKSIDSITSPEE
jgi:hypothetical protein